MTDGYVEVSPQSWEYRLVAAVVRAVEQRAGGGHARTRWNGRLLEEKDPDNLGSAHDDGSLAVSVPQVLIRLREAMDRDRPLTEDEVWLLRDAINTVTHEAVHLMAPLGDRTAAEAYSYDDAASAFDEGRTEHWTEVNLDDVIQDVFPQVGLDHRTVAVLAESSLSAYPAYTAAVRDLDEALGMRSGLPGEQVTERLLVADDAQRWNVAVDMVIDERLARTGLMPESDRAEVRRQLVAPLRKAFGDLAAVEADESLGDDQKAAAGIAAAQKAVAGLDTQLNRIERGYRVERANGTQQQSHRPSSRVNQADGEARQELPPDLKRLQALTAPQASAAGATKQRPAAADRAQSDDADRGRPRGQQTDRPQPRKPPSPQRG